MNASGANDLSYSVNIWTHCHKYKACDTECRLSPFTFDFGWYKDNDVSAQELLYAKRSIEPVVQLFRANRTQMGQLFTLLGDVGDRFIQLTSSEGSHPVPLNQMVVIQATHAREHIGEIRAILDLHTSV